VRKKDGRLKNLNGRKQIQNFGRFLSEIFFSVSEKAGLR